MKLALPFEGKSKGDEDSAGGRNMRGGGYSGGGEDSGEGDLWGRERTLRAPLAWWHIVFVVFSQLVRR